MPDVHTFLFYPRDGGLFLAIKVEGDKFVVYTESETILNDDLVRVGAYSADDIRGLIAWLAGELEGFSSR